jgi:hypothetical protein
MKNGLVGAAIGFAFATMPLPAHHSTRAAYDASKIVTMQGIVTEVRWMNPHARFFLDVTDAAGSTVNWDVELPSPNILLKQGWGRNDLKPGDRMTVDVWLGKDGGDGGHRAYVRILTLPDGRTMSGKSVWDDPPYYRFNQ